MPSEKVNVRTVTIATGQSLSNTLVDFDGQMLLGVIMPAAWDAANLTVQVSHDDTNFNNLYDADGVEVTIVSGASRYIRVNPADFTGPSALKLRSGTAAAAVTQTADRTITLLLWAD